MSITAMIRSFDWPTGSPFSYRFILVYIPEFASSFFGEVRLSCVPILVHAVCDCLVYAVCACVQCAVFGTQKE
eukprot:m.722133 g.722133  ORF g.722133 m.722133 type:complete len:73 (-) comp58821_c0_seq4:22-240(-)